MAWLLSIAMVAIVVSGVCIFVARAQGQEAGTSATPSAPQLTAQQDALIKLGRFFYWDERLSSDFGEHFRRTKSTFVLDTAGQAVRDGRGHAIIAGTSCATCHSPEFGFSDGRAIAVGRFGSQRTPLGRTGNFRSPTTLNAQLVNYLVTPRQFLDLRADDGFEQAVGPIANPDEMGAQSVGDVMRRINLIAGYRPYIQAAFGTQQINSRQYAEACVAYQKAKIVAVDTPLTRYYNGDTKSITDPSGVRGASLFKKHCLECHPKPLYTDGQAANTGIEFAYGGQDDIGLQQTTGNPAHRFMFKKPGLVAISLRRDFLTHESSFRNKATTDPAYDPNEAITALLNHYAAGGAYVVPPGTQRLRDPNIDQRVAAIKLSAQDVADLRHTLLVDLFPADYPTETKPELPQ